jgi:opacity protein-like surface antigen
MKSRISLLLAFFLLAGYSSFAQEEGDNTNAPKDKRVQKEFKHFSIGVFGDATFAWMKPVMEVDNPIQYESDGLRMVAGWGLMFDYNFTENYTLSTGFRFGGYGGKLRYQDSTSHTMKNAIVNRTYKLSYLEIPIDLKLKTNQIGYFTYFFTAGLRPGFRMNGMADDKYELVQVENKSIDLVDSKDLGFFHLSFNVGVGAEYQISRSFSAFASIGYRNGLIDVLKGENGIDPTLSENATLNGLAITAGFIF